MTIPHARVLAAAEALGRRGLCVTLANVREALEAAERALVPSWRDDPLENTAPVRRAPRDSVWPAGMTHEEWASTWPVTERPCDTEAEG